MSQASEFEQRWSVKGFTHFVTHTDQPHTHYAPHTHEKDFLHFIISGDMTLILDQTSFILSKGQEYLIPAGKEHEVKIGEDGCTYISAERLYADQR